MNARSLFIGCIAFGLAGTAFAQVEYDDMYFNSSDRAELNALRASGSLAMNSNKKSMMLDDEVSPNPTDSYSARNINPEYVSRSKAKTAQETEADYFISNYQKNSAASYQSWNNDFNNWYDNPWYTSSWYSPAFSSWNSPYYSPYYAYGSWNSPYSSFYSPYGAWGAPGYDPYYGGMYGPSGYYGSGWSMGMSYGFGYPYCPASLSPWNIGIGYSWYNAWYPRTTVVVVNQDVNGNKVTAGKRPTRTSPSRSSGVTTATRSAESASYPANYPSNYSRGNAGGRAITSPSSVSSTINSRQEAYYNKNWRSSSQVSPSRGTYNNSNWTGSSTPSRSYGGSDSGRSYNNTYDRGSSGSSPSYTPARSSSSGYSGGSSSGSGSNGRSRGRD